MLTFPLLITSEANHQPAPVFIRVFAVFVVLCVLIIIVTLSRFFGLFLQAYMSRVPVTFTQIVGMALRRAKPREVILAAIQARRAGLEVTLDDMEKASVTWPLLDAATRGDYAIRVDSREAGGVVLAIEDRQGRVQQVEGISDIDALARFARGAGFEGTG